MKTSELFVAALVHEGVQGVFGIPGEENLHCLESPVSAFRKSEAAGGGKARKMPSPLSPRGT